MSYEQRKELIQKLEAKRGSSIITLITSDRPSTTHFNGIQGQIAPDQVLKIAEHLKSLQKENKLQNKIELLIYSRGGDINTAWPLVSTIRNYCDKFNILIPLFAHSAATLITLGADEIIMTKTASLSPIDPTVTNPFNPKENNEYKPISVEDVASYIDLAKDEKEVGIKDEKNITDVFLTLARKVHPLALGNVKRTHTQIRLLARKLLELHVKNDAGRILKIIDALSEKLYSHFHLILREESKDFVGLSNIIYADEEEETVLWDIYKDYEEELKLKDFLDLNAYLAGQNEKQLEATLVLIESVIKTSRLIYKQTIRKNLPADPALRLQCISQSEQNKVQRQTIKTQLFQLLTNMQNIRAQIGTIIPPPTNITEINQTFINLENQVSSIIKNTPNDIDISNLQLVFEFNINFVGWI
jgi:hypothetical protein